MRKREKIHCFGLLTTGQWIRWNRSQIDRYVGRGIRNVVKVVHGRNMTEAKENYQKELDHASI